MFAGLQESDLDAYLPARAGSNVYTRPRLEVKQRLLALAPAMLSAASSQGAALEVRASDERPSVWNHHKVTAQWLCLWRDADARKHLEAVLDQGRTLASSLTDPSPFVRHAFLAMSVSAEGVDVSLRVHGGAWVDLKNLRARCADPLRRAELLQALWSAGDLEVSVEGGPRFACRDLDGVRLSQTLDALTDEAQVWSLRALSLDRAAVIARGASLGEDLARAFERLLPLYRLIAWSRENDLVSVEAAVVAAEAERAAHERELVAREDAWRAEHDAEIQRAREAAEVRSHERAASMERARPAVVQEAVKNLPKFEAPAPPPRPAAPSRPKAPSAPKPSPRPAPRAEEAPAPKVRAEPPKVRAEPPKLAAGVKVKITEGPFEGRVGTLLALDGKGGARVNFGLLSARVELGEITPVAG